MLYCLIVSGIVAVILFVLAFKYAPYGWEDEDGFHYGKKG